MNRILVIAEHDQGIVSPATWVTLGCAFKIKAPIDIFLAAQDDTLASDLAKCQGVENVYVIASPVFEHFIAENLTGPILEIAFKYTHILAPSTTFGKNLLPRVAALLDVNQISDVSEVVSPDCFVHPIYAGNAYETVQSLDPIQVLTVRTTAFAPIEKSELLANIIPLSFNVTASEGVWFVEKIIPEQTRPALSDAKIIISGGRALKSAENFKLIEALADQLGAGVGASRAAVDAGFVSNDFQVGQTGKIVAPQLYIAIGISGAVQHLAGMKDSKVIVAINKDAEAPIFQIADYGLVGDLFVIVPELIQALKSN